MQSRSPKWKIFNSKKTSRRSFLKLSAVSLSTASIGTIACLNTASTTPAAKTTQIPTKTSTPKKTTSTTEKKRERETYSKFGETLRRTGNIFSDEIFDPHRTKTTQILDQQSLVYSKLLNYVDQGAGILTTDLAKTLPEQPDLQTFVFQINPEAKWHDRAPVNGRHVRAQDVKHSIERQINGDASYIRQSHWSLIDTIETPDEQTLKIRLKEAHVGMLERFADTSSLIVAPEIRYHNFQSNNQVGSGPFQWVEWKERDFASVSKAPYWHGANGPFLNGVITRQPLSLDDIEANFRTKTLDVALLGLRQAQQLREAIPELHETAQGLAQFYGMRFFSTKEPYNDKRLRGAISIALNRWEMSQSMFAGSATLNPWISSSVERWSLPQVELQNIAGHRPGTGGRQADINEANNLLNSYLNETEQTIGSLGPLELLITEELEKNFSLGTIIQTQLDESLGIPVKVSAVTQQDLYQRLFSGEAPWFVTFDNGWTELDDWLYPYYHSTGTANSFALRDEKIDRLIEKQRVTTDQIERREIGFDVQRELLQLHLASNFVSERVISLQWPYLQEFPLDIGFSFQERLASCWIDQSHPTFFNR